MNWLQRESFQRKSNENWRTFFPFLRIQIKLRLFLLNISQLTQFPPRLYFLTALRVLESVSCLIVRKFSANKRKYRKVAETGKKGTLNDLVFEQEGTLPSESTEQTKKTFSFAYPFSQTFRWTLNIQIATIHLLLDWNIEWNAAKNFYGAVLVNIPHFNYDADSPQPRSAKSTRKSVNANGNILS